MLFNDEHKRKIREILTKSFHESQQDHRHWVEDVCDELPDEVDAIVNEIDESDSYELTDYLHEVMADLKP